MTNDTVTLYRPVGPAELDLIRQFGFRRFPPRLPDQPIFYPVVQEEYAHEIARDWNVKASGSGYVTRFKVRTAHLGKYREQVAGGRDHTEYWIPAEELEAFNDNIVGLIEVVAKYGHPSDLGDWSFDVEEISAGVYRVTGMSRIGLMVELTATDPGAAVAECKRMAMSTLKDSCTVYVKLLDEGVDVYRPTQAFRLGGNRAKLLAPPKYDPENENWEFKPGSFVQIEQRSLEGTVCWVAAGPAGNPGEQSATDP
jgi:hypothetical protein